MKVSSAVVTAANNPRVTSSVEIRHGSRNIDEPPPQMRFVADLYRLFRGRRANLTGLGAAILVHKRVELLCSHSPNTSHWHHKFTCADPIPACVKACRLQYVVLVLS